MYSYKILQKRRHRIAAKVTERLQLISDNTDTVVSYRRQRRNIFWLCVWVDVAQGVIGALIVYLFRTRFIQIIRNWPIVTDSIRCFVEFSLKLWLGTHTSWPHIL